MTFTAEQVAEVLRLVNVARVACALEPLTELPRGRRRDGKRCPIAAALSRGLATGVDLGTYTIGYAEPGLAEKVGKAWDVSYWQGSVDLPHALSAFIRAFDSGEIPQFNDGQPPAEEDGA